MGALDCLHYIYICTYMFIYIYALGHMMYGYIMMYGYNRTSCAQVHELPQSHCDDNREGTLFS